MQKQHKVAVVAGATGMAGHTLVEHLIKQKEWHIVPLARNIDSFRGVSERVDPVQVDLLDRSQLKQALSQFQATHLFYTAWHAPPGGLRADDGPILDPMRVKQQIAFAGRWVVPNFRRSKRLQDIFYRAFIRKSGLLDSEKRNLQMLTNVVEVLAEPPHRLKHASLLTGGRFYGVHMGPQLYPGYVLPATEDLLCHPAPSAYLEMESYLQGRAANSFDWSVIRPMFIVGQSPKPSLNIGYAIAIYAWLLKQMGQPLIFPGGLDSYQVKGQFSDSRLLASMLEWAASEATAANNVFNLVNGDCVSWAEIWPKLGEYFGMQIAIPADGVRLAELLERRNEVWLDLRRKYELPPTPLESVFSPQFLASAMVINWDIELSMNKAHQSGFKQTITTEQMFIDLFGRLEQEKIIPPKPFLLPSQLAQINSALSYPTI